MSKVKSKPVRVLEKIVVHTPAGPPPFVLEGTDREAVANWVGAVLEHYRESDRRLTTQALCYWVRHSYNVNSPEYAVVKEHIYAACGG